MQYVAVVLVFIGVFLVARFDIRGQICLAVSQVLWFLYGFGKEDVGLCLQSLGLFVIAIYACINWKRELAPKKTVSIEKGTRVMF